MPLQLELSGLEEQTPGSMRSSLLSCGGTSRVWVQSKQDMARPGWKALARSVGRAPDFV